MCSRYTVHDDLFGDDRFNRLSIKLGSRELALGSISFAYRLAIKHHSVENTRCLIPVEKWREQNINDLIIEVGLAVLEGDFIYVKGSEERNAWLTNSKANGARGGRPKKPTGNPRVQVGIPLEPSYPIPNPISKNLEEERPAAAGELSLERALEEIHPATIGKWKKRFTDASLDQVLGKGFDYFAADPERLSGRTLAAALVTWVGQERKYLSDRPRPVDREAARKHLAEWEVENAQQPVSLDEGGRRLRDLLGLKIKAL